MSRGDVKLEWVLADDRNDPVHVSEYAHLGCGERPEARCPVCRALVTLALGDDYAHHARHVGSSVCPTAARETAIHLNTKYYIAQQLRETKPSRIQIRHESDGCRRGSWLWLENWSGVEVEASIEKRRPDIQLVRDGVPIGAIEVRVTHAVDDDKAAELERLGVPWAEIVGSEQLYQDPTRWRPTQPLPIVAGSVVGDCPGCQPPTDPRKIEPRQQVESDAWPRAWWDVRTAVWERDGRIVPSQPDVLKDAIAAWESDGRAGLWRFVEGWLDMNP